MEPLEKLKYKIDHLSIEEKKSLIDYIKNSYSIFDSYSSSVSACPVCHSTHIVKNGLRKGVQKYVCRSCNKNFNYKTSTVLSKIQKLNKWNEFVDDYCSLNITPLKVLTKKLKISTQTAFNWRHKLLGAMVLKTNSTFIEEALEYDEGFLKISRKGRFMDIKDKSKYRHWRNSLTGDSNYNVKVFFTYGRNSKQLDVHQSHMGRTSLVHMQNYFTPDKFKNIKVYSDAHITYKGFFKRNNIPHETFIGKKHISYSNKEVHNQTVNSFIRGFKYFVNEHLRGVSTKYLTFYIKWYQFLNQSKLKAFKKEELKFDITDDITSNIINEKFGLELYRQSELSYMRFLKNNGRTNFGDCKHHFYVSKMAA